MTLVADAVLSLDVRADAIATAHDAITSHSVLFAGVMGGVRGVMQGRYWMNTQLLHNAPNAACINASVEESTIPTRDSRCVCASSLQQPAVVCSCAYILFTLCSNVHPARSVVIRFFSLLPQDAWVEANITVCSAHPVLSHRVIFTPWPFTIATAVAHLSDPPTSPTTCICPHLLILCQSIFLGS